MSTRSRKLNALEQKIHQAVLAATDMTVSQKQIDAVESDATKRVEAINFLLGTGLLRIRTDTKGGISYRAVGKKEVEVKKDLAGEEVLVLNHIQAAGNEGIWTKHLKTKTELHQTVIDRCIKSLVQKALIKSIKNVKYPTRKIYMLFHLEPSSSITGGPWYTDNELDTEFIKLLMSACLKFIREKSFPKAKSETQTLFPISAAPAYPTIQQLQAFLTKSRITETQLSMEHVEMLLNVLITDGEIERLPAFGAALWEANSREDEDDSDEEDRRRKRKRKEADEKRDKKRRRKAVQSDSQSGSDEDSDEEVKTKKKRSKSKRAKSDSDSEGSEMTNAILEERVALGWSQAPCGRCPQFEFCKDGGPVNPGQCEYYGDWLNQAEIALE
ncbi:hypothetical protein M0805_005050 [Coniferiporia weirii]|nr:hypothetical protein M0805_005050 [Coniferiporia weirii]